jgi:hypothetical protein
MKILFNRTEDELGTRVTVTNKDTTEILGYIRNEGMWRYISLDHKVTFSGNNRVSIERQVRRYYIESTEG